MAAIVEQKQAQGQAAVGKGSRRVVDKWKKKKWFSILAPAMFDKRPLAETPGEKPKNIETCAII